MKKILVLNGSPRKGGNTELLIDAFKKGAENAGNQVTVFNLQQMDIKPCIGCMQGGKGPDPVNHPCTQIDDMDKIYPVYREADVVVLATPLYYWSFTAQLKIGLDRIYAAIEADNHKVGKKECVLLCVGGGSSEKNFLPMKQYYESLVANMGWRNSGYIAAGGVNGKGDIKGMPFLEEAEELGKHI